MLRSHWFLFTAAGLCFALLWSQFAPSPTYASTWNGTALLDDEDETATPAEPEATEEATTPPIVAPADPAPTLPASDPAPPPSFGAPVSSSSITVKTCLTDGEVTLCIDKEAIPDVIRLLEEAQ